MLVPSTMRFGVIFAALIGWTTWVDAQNAQISAQSSLEPIVVTARKRAFIVPDAVLKSRVESALHDDPFFPDAHVDVTVRNGIAYLDGIVAELADVTAAKHIAKRIPGVRRVVVSDLDIDNGDID